MVHKLAQTIPNSLWSLLAVFFTLKALKVSSLKFNHGLLESLFMFTFFCVQGMLALLDLIFAVEGSISDAAKLMGYMILTSEFTYLSVDGASWNDLTLQTRVLKVEFPLKSCGPLSLQVEICLNMFEVFLHNRKHQDKEINFHSQVYDSWNYGMVMGHATFINGLARGLFKGVHGLWCRDLVSLFTLLLDVLRRFIPPSCRPTHNSRS